MRLYAQFGLLLALVGLPLCASVTTGTGVHFWPVLLSGQNSGQNSAQKNGARPNEGGQKGVRQSEARQNEVQRGQKGQPSNRGEGPVTGAWLERYRHLPPQEQLRALENDSHFKEKTPQEQQELRDRLMRFNQHPPEEQKRMIERTKRFDALPPEQQAHIRDTFRQLRELPQDRQAVVRRAVKDLGDMSPQQRQQVMESDHFKQTFSENERTVLSNTLSALSLIDGNKSEVVGNAPH